MPIGKLIMLAGAVLLALGLIMSYAPWLINWFGRLPGDIRIRNEKSVVFFPIVSMLVISVLLSLILNVFLRK